jgi:DNA polymerase III delta prime subunit
MEPSNTATRDYEIFELLVGPRTAQGYPVTITRSPSGEASELSPLDLERSGILANLHQLQAGAGDALFLAELGCCLFESLFPPSIASLYRRSLERARGAGQGLRIHLRLEAPELAGLPWEYLCDKQEDCFLAVSPETPLVRYVPMPHQAQTMAVRPPLRVLVVLSSPHGLPTLDVDAEGRLVRDALSSWCEQGRVEVRVLDQAHVVEVNRVMSAFRPHVFHFVGHGQQDSQGSYVILEDEQGQPQPMGARTFREFFLGIPEARLVVLNACYLASDRSSGLLAGFAPNLLRRNLSAVVAMQSPIMDQTALVFTREFYRYLALGCSVEEALTEARRSILLEEPGAGFEWGVPVLFLRAKDGRLFEFVAPDAATAPEVVPPPEPLEPPLTPGFVGRRSELDYYSEKARSSHFVVIAGMPGVGKTTLSAVLARRLAPNGKIFWHTLHRGESLEEVVCSLAAFLYYQGQRDLWRTIQKAREGSGPPLPPALLLDSLVQEFRGQGFVLCLDNLHRVEDDPLINYFFDRLRPALGRGNATLIVTAQRTPPFVSRDDIRELSGLSLEDTVEFLALHGIPVTQDAKGSVFQADDLRDIKNLMTHDAIATLHERTGGNPTFLTIAVNALRRCSGPLQLLQHLSAVSDAERFLVDEIDDQLTEEERSVMSAVAVLMSYSGTRGAIESVLDGQNVRRTLRELRRRHLLNVREDEHGRNYKLNSLVRIFYYDMLSQRERQEMHCRAGAYYEKQEPDALKAILHYEKAGHVKHALRLIEAHTQALIAAGQARPLRLVLERLGDQQDSASIQPRICHTLDEIDALLREAGATMPVGAAAALSQKAGT